MKLSIVIPTYNRAELLREALGSIVRTLSTDHEILVCDDGSTDHTVRVCEEFAEAGESVVFCGADRNGGAQVARNRGIERASGDCVLFMDSDDVMQGKGVEQLIDCLVADPSLGFAFGKVIKTDHALRPLADGRTVGSDFPRIPREVAGYHWHTMGAVYRREALKTVGHWNEELSGSQDWEFQARVKLFGGKGEFVDSLVGYWRQHDGERVGAKAFRPDYVRSIMKACGTILEKARQAGKCDRDLERRIAKRLVLHGLEWGTNGHPAERRECFRQAAGGLRSDVLIRGVLRAAAFSPAHIDRVLWKRLVGMNG